MSSTHPQSGDFGLAAALAAHPDARVTGITPDGQFCSIPPGVADDHDRLEATSIFDLVPQEEWGSIGAGWLRVFQHGSYVGSSMTNWGERVSLLSYDAREAHGLIIMLMVSGGTLGDASTDDQRPVVSRFGVYQRDALATVTGADEGAIGLLGWSLEELAGVTANDLIHPDDQANAVENWLMTLASRPDQPRRWRGRHCHRDGSYRWIEFTNINHMNDLGHVVSEMMDISEEMAAVEFLARLNDALPLGVCQIDQHRQVVYANNQLHALVGSQAGSELTDLLHDADPDDRSALLDAVDAVLGDGSDQARELRLTPAGGTDRYLQVALRALRDADGIIGAIADQRSARTRSGGRAPRYRR